LNCDLDILYVHSTSARLQHNYHGAATKPESLPSPLADNITYLLRISTHDDLNESQPDYDQALVTLYKIPTEFSRERHHGVTHSFGSHIEADGMESESPSWGLTTARSLFLMLLLQVSGCTS
jgi:hypothetical protein